nr:hypothetical protein [uncultured Roseateles sp.]
MATQSKKKPARPPRKSAPAAKGGQVPTAKGVRKPRRASDEPPAASPASAGPAGPLLEGHVGAQYLLPLLSGGEARGLPGVVVTRVAFQRGGLGHPMDDVVVTGHDARGQAATLELQAKRTIDFTASDPVFTDVVACAVRAARKPEFDGTRCEIAVAIARTSTKIERHIQEALKWAREYQDAEGFFRRLNQPGAAHRAMRDFVEAFRGHMRTASAPDDDAAVWRLLRRFKVLAFDFEQAGSVCALYARERCAMQLAPQETSRAGELWDSLQQIALEADAAGGDLDSAQLRRRLTSERGFRLAGDRRLHAARERLAEMAANTLATIGTEVHGVRLDRGTRAADVQRALENGRYVEIRGAGGVGKSGVLKDLAQRIGIESRIVVVAPHRIPGGGWAALQAQLGCDATAAQLLTDLAGDGGATLFIDGVDRFDDPREQATVVDLIRATASVLGFRIVATARLDFDADARAWLPQQALQELGEAAPLVIDELGDDEVAQLRAADPALAALLRPGHPAAKLVRNLYRLERLARSAPADGAAPYSEAQMAMQWWTTGDSPERSGRDDRRRLLRALSAHSLSSSAPLDTSGSPTEAARTLIDSGTLREVTVARVEFAHDVLRDWALGCMFYEEPEHLEALPLGAPAPMRLVRGVEIAARLHAENGEDAAAWQTLLRRVSAPGAHGSWRRAVLLALARSERALELLQRLLPVLAADAAALLTELVRTAIAVDSQPAAPLWRALGADVDRLPHDWVAPSGPAWHNLIEWSLVCTDRLPHPAVPLFVDLYGRFCNAYLGHHPLSPRIVERLHAWLCEVEARNHPRVAGGFRERLAAQEEPGLSMSSAQEGDLRTAFLAWCRLLPALAEAYLRGVASHPHRHVVFRQLVAFVGTAAQAAPKALADLFLDALPEGDEEDDDGHRLRDLFSHWDNEYFPASPARRPFLDLLQADTEQGLRLVRGVLAHAVRRRSRGRDPGHSPITVPFPHGARSFAWPQSYMWSRGQPSSIVASALMALESWAHFRIERGESVEAVIADVLGPEDSPAAVLLVAVDVILSHWPQSRACLWPFAASADLLAMDHQRSLQDQVTRHDVVAWVHPEPFASSTLDSLRCRISRRIELAEVLPKYGLHGPDEVRAAMQQALREQAQRLGPPESGSTMDDPRFEATHALNRLDPANYVDAGANENGQRLVRYVAPALEAQLVGELLAKAQGGADIALWGQLARALTEGSCSEALLEEGLAWATRNVDASNEGLDSYEREWGERTRFIVAALVLRDGSPEVKAAHGTWAREQLLAAAKPKANDSERAKLLPYNPAAIAAVGFLAKSRDGDPDADLPSLLHLATRADTGMASVVRAEVVARRPVSPELQRSLLRLGLASAIYALRQRDDDLFQGDIEDYRAREQAREHARKQAEDARLLLAVAAEVQWLGGAGPEPAWPELPEPRPPKEKFVIRLGGDLPSHVHRAPVVRDFALDARAAAEWLSLGVHLWGTTHPDVLRSLVDHCWPWTAGANGVGCGPDEEPGELVSEWNRAYFQALLVAAVAVGEGGIQEVLLKRIEQLPNERFFDATEAVMFELDRHWLDSGRVLDETVLLIRGALVKRLIATRAWHYLVAERSSRTEIHLAGALAAMFMAAHELARGPQCYVLPPGAARAAVLLPMLTELAQRAARSTFVALAFLGLLEVEPHASRLPFLARAVAAWWSAQDANDEFWCSHGVGARVCAWIDKAVLQGDAAADELAGSDLTTMMDTLLRCGIPAAKALDERIAARRGGQPGA